MRIAGAVEVHPFSVLGYPVMGDLERELREVGVERFSRFVAK